MIKIISMIFIFLMMLSCSDTKKDRGKIDQKRDVRTEQWFKNMMMEDIKLLAIKHDIAEDQLTNILNEYEKMTKVFSATEFILSKKEDVKTEVTMREVIDVFDALDRLSDKYNISKQKLSSIIIERKMLKTIERD